MSARSTPVPSGVQAQATAKPDKALRWLRRLCLTLAVVCAAALPFELGVLHTPRLSAGALAHVPLISKLFPAPRPAALPRILSVNNYPRTAVVGRTERFSVRLSGMSHALLTYVLRYPDGREDRARVRADAHGYSSHTFAVTRYRLRHFREVATIGVLDSSGRLHAFKRFAIQQP
jgi:hypothetical protein